MFTGDVPYTDPSPEFASQLRTDTYAYVLAVRRAIADLTGVRREEILYSQLMTLMTMDKRGIERAITRGFPVALADGAAAVMYVAKQYPLATINDIRWSINRIGVVVAEVDMGALTRASTGEPYRSSESMVYVDRPGSSTARSEPTPRVRSGSIIGAIVHPGKSGSRLVHAGAGGSASARDAETTRELVAIVNSDDDSFEIRSLEQWPPVLVCKYVSHDDISVFVNPRAYRFECGTDAPPLAAASTGASTAARAGVHTGGCAVM